MSQAWSGVTRAETLNDWAVEAGHQLAYAGRRGDWRRLLALLDEHPEMVNTWRPGGRALYAPLHHVAYGNGPAELVQELVARGAWRTLRSARGERPVDVARRRGHERLLEHLEPQLCRQIPADVLTALERGLHEVILSRTQKLVDEHALRLPPVEPLLEMRKSALWFPVPGMYGGFQIRLTGEGATAEVVTSSWCRVVGGSGMRHRITAEGWELVQEGFV